MQRPVPLALLVAWSFVESACSCHPPFNDPHTEFRCNLQLARQGNAWAQKQVGYMYFTGEGVSKDCTSAVKWYTKAAEQGLDVAQVDLGELLCDDLCTPGHQNEGIAWLVRAADQGNPFIQGRLAIIFLKAECGGKPDLVQAYTWLTIASTPDAIRARAVVADSMTPDQISVASERAASWKPAPGLTDDALRIRREVLGQEMSEKQPLRPIPVA